MLWTRIAYTPASRAAAELGLQALDLDKFDFAVLAAIADQQPIWACRGFVPVNCSC